MQTFCCERMTHQVNFAGEAEPDPAGIPQDRLLTYSPLCGTGLPSYRDAWFDVLDALGIEDPLGVMLDAPETEEVPPRLRDDRWWRDRPSEEPPPSDDSVVGRGLNVSPVDPEVRRSRGGLRLSTENPCCDQRVEPD